MNSSFAGLFLFLAGLISLLTTIPKNKTWWTIKQSLSFLIFSYYEFRENLLFEVSVWANVEKNARLH